MKVRTIIAAGALVVAGAAGGASAASAASSVYSTSSSVKTVYNGKCIHTHTRTVRDMGYSSKAGRYIQLSKPSVTVSDSYRCHA